MKLKSLRVVNPVRDMRGGGIPRAGFESQQYDMELTEPGLVRIQAVGGGDVVYTPRENVIDFMVLEETKGKVKS